MNMEHFEIESKNRKGYPVKILCKSTSPLSCEVSIVPIDKNHSEHWLYYSLIGIAVGCLTVNAWTYLITQTISDAWITFGTFLCLLVLWLEYMFFNPVKETIIVIKSIGIQVKTLYSSGRETSTFVDQKCIADIIINEAITMHQVIYYLAIVQNTNEQNKKTKLKLIPLFMSLQPRLEALKPIYHFIRSVSFTHNANEKTLKSLPSGKIT